MLARLKTNAFKFVVLPILLLLALFASVYAISKYMVYRDTVAYGDPYEPPKEELDINQRIIKRQLAQAKARNAHEREAPVLAQALVIEASRPESVTPLVIEPCSALDPDRSNPEKCTATGSPLDGPDPCEGHRDPPDFTSVFPVNWPMLCTERGTPAERCAAWLEIEWSIGNDAVHESFRLPPGCLP